MKRSVFTLLLAMFFVQSGMAQVNFGPKINLINSNLKLEDELVGTRDGDYRFGMQAGAFLRFNLPADKWYIQSEALISWSNGQVSDVGLGTFRYAFDRVEVPVLVGRKIGPVRVNAGPVARINFETKITDRNGAMLTVGESLRSASFGYQLGAGMDLWKLTFDLKYEGSLTNITDPNERVIFNSGLSINQLIFGIGYVLF